MNTTPQFYICKHCGNLVDQLFDSGVDIICCGDPMTLMEANTVDASQEKHVPAFEVNGDKISVQIGSDIHPMLEEHYIGWIWLQTKLGGQRKKLQAGDEPKATFTVADGDEPIALFEWCNLHGLWKADVK